MTNAPGRRHGLTLRQVVLGAAVLVAAGAVAAVSTVSRAGGQAPVADALPVTTLTVEPVTSYSLTSTFSGALHAHRTVDLAFEVGGRLDAVAVDEGAWVEAGATLARLNRRRLEAQREALAAQRAQAAAVLAELEAGPRAETIATARARVREQETAVALLTRKRQRREQLRARGVVTGEELDEVTTALAAATARAEATHRQLDELLAGTRPERLAAQRAQLDRLDAELERLAIELKDTDLLAPFTGRVAAVVRDPGTVLAAGQPVVRLVEAGALEAWVGVPADLPAPSPGAEVVLTIGGRPVPGRLSAVLPELDPATRTATWVIAVDGPTDGLFPGAVVRLRLERRYPGAGVWLPLSALDQGQGPVWSCLTVVREGDGFVVERHLVEVVALDGERVLVRGALPAGAAVVATGTARIVPGQRVAPSVPPRGGELP